MNEKPSTAQAAIASAALIAASAAICAVALPFVIVGAILNIPAAICKKTGASCNIREL